MTPLEHPSDEQLADLDAGSLPAQQAMRVNAHVAGCDECRDLRAALSDVAALLADVGAIPEPMPVDVEASLHAALQAAQRAESGRRDFVAARADSTVPTMRRRLPKWLAGAAAAVVLTSTGVAAWQVLPHTSSDYSADSGSGPEGLGSRVVPGGNAGAGKSQAYDDGEGSSFSLRRVAPTAVANAARQLESYSLHSRASDLRPCAVPAGSGRRELIRWRGDPAVFVVRPAERSATVLDCATARRVLFSTRY